MNKAILQSKVQEYIDKNLKTDIHAILLKKSPFNDVSSKELVEQIESKRKCEKKLPNWFHTKNIYYPNKLNLSQSSSIETAEYKANLVSGTTLIDITGGFGIDAVFFAKRMQTVIHIEKNAKLSTIAKYNSELLDTQNITFITGDGVDYIAKRKDKVDWVYLDPSRRSIDNKKVFYLSDCEPDITKILDVLFAIAHKIMIKTGPLLDLKIGLQQLKFVSNIHIVANNNEVKEILWVLEKSPTSNVKIQTVNIKKTKNENFDFLMGEELRAETNLSSPKSFLYEPNAAILKSGAFNLVGNLYELHKLHLHSHLYTSDKLVDFPGRIFIIDAILPYSKKHFKKSGIVKANITIRNFPNTVNQIRQKLSITEGGELYLFFTTDIFGDLKILKCRKYRKAV